MPKYSRWPPTCLDQATITSTYGMRWDVFLPKTKELEARPAAATILRYRTDAIAPGQHWSPPPTRQNRREGHLLWRVFTPRSALSSSSPFVLPATA
jgi:hypothetical protein